MILLTAFSFFVFLIPAEDVADRINLILTLMLTQVAFKFVTIGIVPKVGYSTHLDKFLFLNMIFFLVIAIFFAFQYWFPHTWTNLVAFFSTVGVGLFFGTTWICSVVYSPDTNNAYNSAIIKVKSGTNWYAFNYANPKFMKLKDT